MTAGIIAGVFGAIVFVLWMGAQSVIAGTMSAGPAHVVHPLCRGHAGGIGVIAEVWGDVMRAAGATERLMELLARCPSSRAGLTGEASRNPAGAHHGGAGALPLSVAAGHGRAGRRHARNQGRRTVALVGPSGAGKTTLFQLLLRFYDVGSGVIRFNGVDIRTLDPADLRAHIGIVPQDAVIFSRRRAREHPLRQRRCERRASDGRRPHGARDEFIARLARQVPDVPGERGVRLSGGQRQRIAIAPRHSAQSAAAAPRRSHQRAGRGKRAAGPARPRGRHAQPDHLDHRAPPFGRCSAPTASSCWNRAASSKSARRRS